MNKNYVTIKPVGLFYYWKIRYGIETKENKNERIKKFIRQSGQTRSTVR